MATPVAGQNVPLRMSPVGLPMAGPLPAPVENIPKFMPQTQGLPAGLSPAMQQALGAQQAAGMLPPQGNLDALSKSANKDAATGLPKYFDPEWYVKNNPDVLAGFNSQKDKGEGMAWYGKFHYKNFGNDYRYLGPQDPRYLAAQGAQPAGQAPAQAAPAGVSLPPALANLSPEQIVQLQGLISGMQGGQLQFPLGGM